MGLSMSVRMYVGMCVSVRMCVSLPLSARGPVNQAGSSDGCGPGDRAPTVSCYQDTISSFLRKFQSASVAITPVVRRHFPFFPVFLLYFLVCGYFRGFIRLNVYG